MGPALVAAVAYVDPGNVATNTAAGVQYRYMLLWVLVGATLMAGLVQYLSAKVGWLTGESLPSLVAERTSRPVRLAYWAQAELVAMATDIAEIVGGAIALQLLFGLDLVLGAVITATVSTFVLMVQSRRSQRTFERVITSLLAIVAVGFVAGLFVDPPDKSQVIAGLLPTLAGPQSALLAVGMLGATVMPHAVYLHSALVRDRHGKADPITAVTKLRSIKFDVIVAMVIAGTVNISMLLVSGSALFGLDIDGIDQVHAAIGVHLGPSIALLFAIGLLASGLASTSVGGYAGAVIMDGLLKRRLPVVWRRLITAIPALVLLGAGFNATNLLILSQVVLSFGIPFVLVPLVLLARSPRLMAFVPTRKATIRVAWLATALIIALNVVLVVLLVR
ncbi:MAG TPA: Nramp family divalent metal transporter [Propionibacteriaceae bacterium]